MIINSRHEFYKSKEWSLCKLDVLDKRTKEDGMVYCEYCGKPIMKVFDPLAGKRTDEKAPNRNAMVFHHTIELTDDNFMDYNISLNPKLIQILHWKCHNKEHNRFQGGTPKKKVYLVYGSSCSGKTTWVREQMGDNDIVLDIDDLWEYVSKKPRYIKPNTYKDLVFALWREYQEQIKMRTGYWENAFIITSEPLSTQRKRIADSFNAELIHIDTSKQVCLERLYSNPNGRNISEYEKYILDYFDKFTE